MNAAGAGQDQAVGEEAGGRRRARDRGFQRPGGPALVARPEPLATAPATLPAPPAPAEPEQPPRDEVARVEQRDDEQTMPRPEQRDAAAPKAAKQGKGAALPMPPARHVELRVQFNTKLRPATISRTRAFADHHQATVQDVVELALDEYLTRRDWPAATDS